MRTVSSRIHWAALLQRIYLHDVLACPWGGRRRHRLDALEKSPERKATRKADHAALDTLSKRGITTAERARLRALVTTATTAAKAEKDAADDGAPNEAVLKLHAWYGEWSEVARAVIKRRDHLIRLGLAKRKKTVKDSPGTPE